MKLYKIEEVIDKAKKKAEQLKEELGITEEQARIAYAVASGVIPYNFEGIQKNSVVISMLKHNILKNIFGEEMDIDTLVDFLKFSLIYNKCHSSMTGNFGKYVIREHISEIDDAFCNIDKLYIICDWTNEEEIFVHQIITDLWGFNTVQMREEEWEKEFPGLYEEVVSKNQSGK